MESKIKDWQKQIKENTQVFLSSFGELSPEQLTFKPHPDTWSIEENIQHLMVINQSYFPIFKQLEEGTYEKPFIGNFGFLTKILGNTILKSVSPEQPKKLKTIPIWAPDKFQGEDTSNLLKEFEGHQNELSQWVGKLAPFLEKGQIIHSPANKLIAYPLSTAVEIIITHEKRHFSQSKNILTQLK
ncbi:DinB family protein [Echinicola marina]|uniref:DinB family protein n=1 Tax=Echinicola marina TaxID=2859768 RepID=UPI001CF61188|nr:DinB family protein [Echinicola marina]UCS91626.1 DinB family protein [Echinicola marina]